MSAPRTPSRAFTIIALVLLTGGAVFLYFSPACSQQRVMRRAQEHIDTRLVSLTTDPRYATIEFHAATTENILITGTIGSQEALATLRETVLATNPPVPLRWNVYGNDMAWLSNPDGTVPDR